MNQVQCIYAHIQYIKHALVIIYTLLKLINMKQTKIKKTTCTPCVVLQASDVSLSVWQWPWMTSDPSACTGGVWESWPHHRGVLGADCPPHTSSITSLMHKLTTSVLLQCRAPDTHTPHTHTPHTHTHTHTHTHKVESSQTHIDSVFKLMPSWAASEHRFVDMSEQHTGSSLSCCRMEKCVCVWGGGRLVGSAGTKREWWWSITTTHTTHTHTHTHTQHTHTHHTHTHTPHTTHPHTHTHTHTPHTHTHTEAISRALSPHSTRQHTHIRTTDTVNTRQKGKHHKPYTKKNILSFDIRL